MSYKNLLGRQDKKSSIPEVGLETWATTIVSDRLSFIKNDVVKLDIDPDIKTVRQMKKSCKIGAIDSE